MQQLGPDEELLTGKWVFENGHVISNETCDRINFLTCNSLKKIGTSSDGWSVLYQDPQDDRLWELSYQNSSSHGAGPPVLKVLTRDEVAARYSRDVPK
ncbi:Imm27 family immunity protein [Pseudovibrio denitrificans]|uniref:Imm27 family immunity protein n=1 Tax=Pseudovibrio denitrificans TaxID=258256 RepID=UPI0039BFF11D